MIIFLLLCNILVLPLSHGTISTSKVDHQSTATTKTLQAEENKKTKITLPSEGGTVLADDSTPIVSQNQSMLLNLDKEMGNTKVKPVKPRKGVTYNNDPEDIVAVQSGGAIESKTHEDIIPPKKLINDKSHENTLKAILATKNVPVKETDKKTTETLDIKVNKPVTTTQAPKKPLVLSYEVLSSIDSKNQNDMQIPAMKSSSKTLVSDQLQSPNKPVVKAHLASTSGHPGMIMPVVITILVVPMFAVLGYLAVKRGQEAWKNRHYKRMDFLLDGMYND